MVSVKLAGIWKVIAVVICQDKALYVQDAMDIFIIRDTRAVNIMSTSENTAEQKIKHRCNSVNFSRFLCQLVL